MVCVRKFAFFFFFKFTFDGSNQTSSSGVNLTSDWCQSVCHGTVSLYRFWLYCPKFRSSSSNFYLLSGVTPVCCVCCVVLSLQVSGVPEEQLLVALDPGLPSTAELFILPDERSSSEHKRGSEEALETVRTLICGKWSCGLSVKTAKKQLSLLLMLNHIFLGMKKVYEGHQYKIALLIMAVIVMYFFILAAMERSQQTKICLVE